MISQRRVLDKVNEEKLCNWGLEKRISRDMRFAATHRAHAWSR